MIHVLLDIDLNSYKHSLLYDLCQLVMLSDIACLRKYFTGVLYRLRELSNLWLEFWPDSLQSLKITESSWI